MNLRTLRQSVVVMLGIGIIYIITYVLSGTDRISDVLFNYNTVNFSVEQTQIGFIVGVILYVFAILSWIIGLIIVVSERKWIWLFLMLFTGTIATVIFAFSNRKLHNFEDYIRNETID